MIVRSGRVCGNCLRRRLGAHLLGNAVLVDDGQPQRDRLALTTVVMYVLSSVAVIAFWATTAHDLLRIWATRAVGATYWCALRPSRPAAFGPVAGSPRGVSSAQRSSRCADNPGEAQREQRRRA